MQHRTTKGFRNAYNALPSGIQLLADKSFALLRTDPKHPSLYFKKVPAGWSARVGLQYRALAAERSYGFLWYWIGTHAEYDKLIK